MSYLVGNPKDRFSCDEAHIVMCPKKADIMAKSVDNNQTALCLCYLPSPACWKT